MTESKPAYHKELYLQLDYLTAVQKFKDCIQG